MAKWVYMFSEGDMTMRNLLGGKGANLAEMTSIGLPVPQDLQSQLRLVPSITKMVARLTTRSWHRPWKALRRWKSSMERNLAI